MYLSLINEYGILILVLIFILINLYFKNLLNILILILLHLFLRNIVSDRNALFLAYVLSLLYGITKNFHLLENFDSNKLEAIEKPITEHKIINKLNKYIEDEFDMEDNDIKLKHLNNYAKKKLKKISKNTEQIDDVNINKNNNKTNKTNKNSKNSKSKNFNSKNLNSFAKEKQEKNKKNNKNEKKNNLDEEVPNVDSIISENMINEFITLLKKNGFVNVKQRSMNLYELKPTISKINKKKIKKISKYLLNGGEMKNIVISNDKFIIDGHHRWVAKKSIIENNTNGYNDTNIYSENIKVIIIDYPIKKLIQKLQEYKIKYNKELISKSVINIDKYKESNKEIKKIKNKLKVLEENYEKLNTIKV